MIDKLDQLRRAGNHDKSGQESEQQAKNSQTWLLWRRAAETVEKVRKDAGSKLFQDMPN